MPTRSEKSRREVAEAAGADEAIRGLCAALLSEPGRLVETLTHAIDRPFVIRPHRHESLIQFDLLVACAGRIHLEAESWPIRQTTAMIAYPGQEHGYELAPDSEAEPGRVFHVKLAVEEVWPLVRGRLLPNVVTQQPAPLALTAALRAVVRLGGVPSVRPPMLLVRLAEALCLWPQDTAGGEPPHQPPEDADLHARMHAAVTLIEQRPHDPPTLDELAEAACYTPRHFARRFRQLYGCTPSTYINARRLELAKESLLQERLPVRQVAEWLGFGSVATFSRWFSRQAGMSPSAYRRDPSVL